MKKFLSIMVLATMAMAFTFVSCGDDDKTELPVKEDNELSGSITSTLQLDAAIEYELVGPLIVEEGACWRSGGHRNQGPRGF